MVDLACFTFGVPIWLLVLLSVFTLWSIVRWLLCCPSPSVKDYTEDDFGRGVRWRWVWEPSPGGLRVANLLSYCPVDDCRLVPNASTHKYLRCEVRTCTICRTSWDLDVEFADVYADVGHHNFSPEDVVTIWIDRKARAIERGEEMDDETAHN